MGSPSRWRRWRRKVYVTMTAHNGQGVFARRQISPGEVVLMFTGRRLSLAEVKRDEERYVHSLQIGPDAYLSPSGGEDDYINHSCDPNCEAVDEDGRIFIEAIRTIAAGEELGYDYGITLDERHTLREKRRWPCFCGAANCRRTLLGAKR